METKTRSWAEFLLPIYAVALIYIYFRPETVPHQTEGGAVGAVVVWSVWAVIGTLAGILAISALVVAFYLLYSPIYLMHYGNRLVWAHKSGTVWTDRREVQFYALCFVILCALGGLALYDPMTAAVAFVLLAGVAPLAWRIACKHRT
jgi:di/tricarboxylate transporter